MNDTKDKLVKIKEMIQTSINYIDTITKVHEDFSKNI